MSIRSALLSVSDKTGLVDFAHGLKSLGVNILSTGGTALVLRQAGINVEDVADYTGSPEILQGRVKTLHPKVHAGILYRRDQPEDQTDLQAQAWGGIDLVCVNLYPFAKVIAKLGCSFEEAIENIDIGGPTLLRAGAKNHAWVTVVVDPQDYSSILAEIAKEGDTALHTRLYLASKVFTHTAHYESLIRDYLEGYRGDKPALGASTKASSEGEGSSVFPTVFSRVWHKVQDLRYGENPHQSAAFYRDPTPPQGSLALATLLQGKPLSYNNLNDAHAALECVREFYPEEGSACVIIKHANPCGVALAVNPVLAYQQAFAADPQSAYGGIIAFNCCVDEATAQSLIGQFAEVILAPEYTPQALSILSAKPSWRILALPLATKEQSAGEGAVLASTAPAWTIQSVSGGILLQEADTASRGGMGERQEKGSELAYRWVTSPPPASGVQSALSFAWRIAKYVKSNAIVVVAISETDDTAKGGFCTVGIGAGQMSRVDSAYIALHKMKASPPGLRLVAASDAFFPFRDGVDMLATAGVEAIIQPGGSVRDEEVISAAKEHGIAMCFTGVRHFRH